MYGVACVVEQESLAVRTAMSESRDAETVAQDLARQLIHPYLGFVLFFCSAEYDLPALGNALHQYFGGVRMVGCTSAGEITPQGYGRSCVTAVGFDRVTASARADAGQPRASRPFPAYPDRSH